MSMLNKSGLYLKACIGILLLATFVPAMAHAINDSIPEKFRGEAGLYTRVHEHLILEFVQGKLTARSEVERELLVLNDNAVGYFNTGSVHHSYFNQLRSLEGATLLPTDKGFTTIKATSIRTRPSASESVFYDDSKESEITFTHLKAGAKTQLKYSLQFQDIHMLPRFYFQSGLPVLDATFQVTYPKGVALEGIMQGSQVDWINKTVEERRKTITVTWRATDVPKWRIYNDGPRINYFIPHLVLFVKQYEAPGSKQQVPVLDNLASLNRYLHGFVKNVNTKSNPQIESIVAGLTASATSDAAKARNIFQWVQSNIRYVAFEDSLGGFIPREAAEVCRRRFGDCKDMAGLLRSMCIAAGLDARYCWIGTRDIPYQSDVLPIPALFNHMICAVRIGQEWIFLDATDPIVPFGAIPQGIQGKEAFIGNTETDFEIVKLPVAPALSSQLIDSSFVQLNEDDLIGNASIHCSGYNAWDIKSVLKYRNEKDKEKAFDAFTRRGSNKYAQKKFEYLLHNDKAHEVQIKATFELPDYITRTGSDYYINLNLHKTLSGNRVEPGERIAPLVHDYKEIIRQVVVLQVPAGFRVLSLPEDRSLKVDGIGAFAVQYRKEGDTVILSKEIDIEGLYIQPDQFKSYNKFINELLQAYKESVTLSKAI